MPYSKYEPDRPPEAAAEGTTPSATRRSRVLRWATVLTWIYTAIGFGFIVYWLTK